MHQATAIAGSGPAYYFLFFKYFTEYLIEHGFDNNTAKEIVTNTCDAALSMAQHSNDFEQLIANVTSPKGTTDAALRIFQEQDQLKKIFNKALTSASNRSQELANNV